jgi:hypothetical protein
MASSSLVHPVYARAWVLNAAFDIAEHPQLADPDTNQIFPKYAEGILIFLKEKQALLTL